MTKIYLIFFVLILSLNTTDAATQARAAGRYMDENGEDTFVEACQVAGVRPEAPWL